MTIQQDIQKSAAPGIVELFILDLSTIPGMGSSILRYTPSSDTPIIWDGQQFNPWPVMIEGIEQSANGAPARPKLTFGNLDAGKVISSLVYQYSDIIGAKVSYIKTFEPYTGGAGNLSIAPMKFTIGKKLAHDYQFISFELRSPLDRERAYLPPRQMLKRDFPGLGINKHYR